MQQVRLEQEFHKESPGVSWTARVLALGSVFVGGHAIYHPHELIPWYVGVVLILFGLVVGTVPGGILEVVRIIVEALPFTKRGGVDA